MRRYIHPSKAKLGTWLETGGPEKVDGHVVTCERCAARLESIDTPGPTVRDALLLSLEAPEDLAARMAGQVESALKRREEFFLLAGLLSVPFETVKVVAAPPENPTT